MGKVYYPGIQLEPWEVYPSPGAIWQVQGDLVSVPGDGANLDAFGRQRTSDPTGLFAYQHQYDEGPTQWEYWTTGGGSFTHLPNESSVLLSAAGGDVAGKQTRQYYRYQPGKSQLILLTGVLDQTAPAVGHVKELGYYDDRNGIFFRRNGLDLEVVRRTFVSGVAVDNPVLQSAWNIDTMDGLGPSGITLDTTKSNIYVIDLEWLGVGRVRMGLNIDGVTYYVHEFLNANNLATVYMTTANLPIRYYVTNGGAGTAELKAICTSISSEGGFEIEQGVPFCVDNGVNVITCPQAVPTHVLSIRPKATFNGQTNRARILPVTFETYGEANSAHWGLLYNTTVAGGAWVSAHPNSVVEYNVTATYTGGQPVECGYIPVSGTGNKARAGQRGGSQDLFLYLPVVLDRLGANPIPLTIYAEGISGPSDVAAAIGWLEFK
jgi:hypothetical protein